MLIKSLNKNSARHNAGRCGEELKTDKVFSRDLHCAITGYNVTLPTDKVFSRDLHCAITGCNVTLPTDKVFFPRLTLHDYRMQRHVADGQSIFSRLAYARLQDATSRCRSERRCRFCFILFSYIPRTIRWLRPVHPSLLSFRTYRFPYRRSI